MGVFALRRRRHRRHFEEQHGGSHKGHLHDGAVGWRARAENRGNIRADGFQRRRLHHLPRVSQGRQGQPRHIGKLDEFEKVLKDKLYYK